MSSVIGSTQDLSQSSRGLTSRLQGQGALCAGLDTARTSGTRTTYCLYFLLDRFTALLQLRLFFLSGTHTPHRSRVAFCDSETALLDAVIRYLRGRIYSFEFWSGTPVTRIPWVENYRYSYNNRPDAALCTYLQVHRGLFGVLPPTASSPHVVRPRSAICSDSVRCLPPTF